MQHKRKSILSTDLVLEALQDSLVKLNPQTQFRNPVMFVTYLGAIFTTILTFVNLSAFNIQISIWLWFTVLFANFASAIAESRGKAQAASLRKAQTESFVKKLVKLMGRKLKFQP